MATRKNGISPLMVALHVGAFVPLLWTVWDFWQGNMALAINPFQEVTFRTGKAALILLLLSLAVTPVNSVFGWRQVIPMRKWLGLYAFMYGLLHFAIFIVDNGLVGGGISAVALYEATFKKRFALVGFAALMILLPLAVTSNKWAMRQLKKNWKRLHRLVYLAGVLVIVHFIWLVKSDVREPLIYGAVLTVLLALRVPAVRKSIRNLRSRRKNPRTIAVDGA
ncbi:MAG: sulfoxide reductase heme-binding subunit YedZ [Chloroflexi bacterium]|nr:MAG: sulfoxide reductase heme-binding subunit YedZ [Chloroflexota bacterium]